MEVELPKRIFCEGNEPKVIKVNNSCRISIMRLMKKNLPNEYREIRGDPVFRHIMALFENNLGYSARLIHSFICRQLDISKLHELWFVFGRRPLRFLMQEFYAVTGLKCEKGDDPGFGIWVEDNSFWRELLKAGTPICIQQIRKIHVKDCKQWKRVDRVRLVYVCIIGGLIMPLDEKTAIPHKYIKLVMDLAKLRAYHWGIDSFDHLLAEMKNAKPKLTNLRSYPLHGFSYAFQIWIMEAIPDFGKMMGHKLIENNIVFPRCLNWKGHCFLTYPEINKLESLFGEEAVLHPFISSTGNCNIIRAVDYKRTPEMRDERVDRIYELIASRKVWTNHIWEVMVAEETLVPQAVVDEEDTYDEEETEDEEEEEAEDKSGDTVPDVPTTKPEVSSASTSMKGKSRVRDYSVKERKQKVLCERSAGKQVANNEEIKCFMKELLEAFFTSMETMLVKKIETEIAARFSVVHTEIRDLKDLLTTSKLSASRGDTCKTTKVVPVTTRSQSQSQKKKANKPDVATNLNDMLENLHDVGLSQTSDMDLEISTQEFVCKTKANISNKSKVKCESPTPLPTKAREEWKKLSLTDLDENSYNEPDKPLIFYKWEDCERVLEWGWGFNNPIIHIGPSELTYDLADRFISRQKWLLTPDIDAAMYLLREKASLGLWNVDGVDRAGFMSCNFSAHIQSEYIRFQAEKKSYELSPLLLDYGRGELPAHGRTGKVWDVDLDRIYVPFNVRNYHWISLCIDFKKREVLVFDCDNGTRYRDLDSFLHMIPRIVKVVQPPSQSKELKLAAYKINHQQMPKKLNRLKSHCGPYALKYIECHMLGLDYSLLDDETIMGARLKLIIDMFLAAHDPVFLERMAKYVPPVTHTDSTIVDLG